MEPIFAGRKVLSDIEQSIENALALINSKDLGVEVDNLQSNKNSTVPSQSIQIHEFNISQISSTEKLINDVALRSLSPLEVDYSYDKTTVNDKIIFDDSITTPFSEHPIQDTLEEIQRVLNEKYVDSTQFHNKPSLSPNYVEAKFSPIPSPRFSTNHGSPRFSPADEPSPEEILNLYSQDLGICQSSNVSPRENNNLKFSDSKIQTCKSNKKDTKNSKKQKQKKLKVNLDRKFDVKNKKNLNSENITSKENRLKELMNIYGCSGKLTEHHSNSTLGPKSVKLKNRVPKSQSNSNLSIKTSSKTITNKSKKKILMRDDNVDLSGHFMPLEQLSMQSVKRNKNKLLTQDDVDLSVHYMSLEQISRQSVKRKAKKEKTNDTAAMKQNLKRKKEVKLSTDNSDMKINKSHQTYHSSSNYKQNKSNNQTKDLKYQKPNKQRNSNKRCPLKDKNNISEDVTLKPIKNTILKPIPHDKSSYLTNRNTKCNIPDTQNNKKIVLNKQPIDLEVEQIGVDHEHFSKIFSEELTSNKHQQFLGSDNAQHNYINENTVTQNQQISYNGRNEDFIDHLSQLHYALPTHSSRSKEVERFLSYSYQHLPFVIGQSTNKSHNLWVNIQEALSLIKHKVPQVVEEQSAGDHGIMKEAVDNEGTFSVISKLSAKTVKKPHQCPALMNDSLYEIPECNEDTVKSWENHPVCIQANIDPNYVRPRCSCLTQPSLSYKKVLRQIFGGSAAGSFEATESVSRIKGVIFHDQGDNYILELRKVLISLTQEFEELNNKYDEMMKDPNVSKEELQQIENTLRNKEEEIQEVIARFNEIKEINEKTQMMDNKSRAGFGTLDTYKSTTSIRMVQTLRRVQQLKESLKSLPSVPFLTKSVHVQST